MKRLLLISLIALSGCDIAKQVAKELLKRDKPPTPVATATPTIGEAPTILSTPTNRCAPSLPPQSCKEINFDGNKGGMFLRISRPPNRAGIKFGHQGDVLSAESVKVCQRKKCYELKFDECHNPDHTAQGMRPRAHYYFAGPTDLKGPATVTLDDCVYRARDIRGTE